MHLNSSIEPRHMWALSIKWHSIFLLQGGREYFAAVTVTSVGRLGAKVEVYAKIVKSTGKRGSTRLTSYPRNPGLPNLPLQQPAAVKPSTAPNSNTNVVYTSDNKTLPASEGEIAHTKDDKTEQQSVVPSNDGSQESATTKPDDTADPSLKQAQSNPINILLIPSIVVVTSLIVSAIIAYLFRKKLCRKRYKISKDDLVSTWFEYSVNA